MKKELRQNGVNPLDPLDGLSVQLPTATMFRGAEGPGGSNKDHEVPKGSILVIPNLTRAFPCQVTAQTSPVGPTLI